MLDTADDLGPSVELREPYRSQFETLIRSGAADQDIHDSGDAPAAGTVSQRFVDRELERVDWHLRSLVPLLEEPVGQVDRILDFGCGTGGTTVALALSSLGAGEVIGVDANPAVLDAARVRGDAYDLAPPRLRFVHTTPGAPLPFADGSFALVTTVSVLEFISRAADRDAVVDDLRRLVAPGGYLYIATPSPRLREHHSRFWLGDVRRTDGFPWASPPWRTRRWGRGWERISVAPHLAERLARRVPGVPARWIARTVGPLLPYAATWQKLLFRRPG